MDNRRRVKEKIKRLFLTTYNNFKIKLRKKRWQRVCIVDLISIDRLHKHLRSWSSHVSYALHFTTPLSISPSAPGEEAKEDGPSLRNSCPKGSQAYGSYCYALFKIPKSWFDADVSAGGCGGGKQWEVHVSHRRSGLLSPCFHENHNESPVFLPVAPITYMCPPFTSEISVCDSFCPSSPSWPARRGPQDTLCLCSVDLRLPLCPPWLNEVQAAANVCGLGSMTQHWWDSISSHLICLSLILFPGPFSVFLWGKTQLCIGLKPWIAAGAKGNPWALLRLLVFMILNWPLSAF